MRRPRAGDERSSQALGRRRGSARRPIRAACQELADGSNAREGYRRRLTFHGYSQGAAGGRKEAASPGRESAKRGPAQQVPLTTVGEAEADDRK